METERITCAVGDHRRLVIAHVHWHTIARTVAQHAVLEGFVVVATRGQRLALEDGVNRRHRSEPRTTPIESPQSNGMAEAFVRTIKRDYVYVSPRPNAEAVLRQLPSWIAHYNEVHPHKALGYRSPREFITAHEKP